MTSTPETPRSPYGRDQEHVLRISDADAVLLSGAPAPLVILVPVTIEE